MGFSGALADLIKGQYIRGNRKGIFRQQRVPFIKVDPLATVFKDGVCGYWIRPDLSPIGWKGYGQ
jgi:hypothetical protein